MPPTVSEQHGSGLRDGAALRLQSRLRRLLCVRGLLGGSIVGLWVAGFFLLALRFSELGPAPTQRLGLLAAIALLVSAGAGLAAARRAPSLSRCRAAVDASSHAGGLILCAAMHGAESWVSPASRLPRVRWDARRHLAGLSLALVFGLAMAFLPSRFFTYAPTPPPPTVQALVEQVAERIAEIEEAELLPEPVVAALTNQLARIGDLGDVSDPARTLEALDHIASELERAAAAEADSLVAERTALQAASALTDMLAGRLEELAANEALARAAAEAMGQLLEQSALQGTLSSNLLAAVAAPNGLDAATLAELARMLEQAGAANEAQLARMIEMKLAEAGQCQGEGESGGAEANAANAAALRELLAQDSAAADAAAALAALCEEGGDAADQSTAGIARGPGAAPMTWTDASDYEGVEFEDSALTQSGLPDARAANLAGISATSPEVPEQAVATQAGALAADGVAQGHTPQTPILPRHRGAVNRFFK